jgi:hypothetical protein
VKEMLMAYAIRAHEVSRACDNFTCAAGFRLGYTDTQQHLRNNERDKYMQVLRFPENLPLVPVVIFSIGVTCRLVRSVVCAAILRTGSRILEKANPDSKK